MTCPEAERVHALLDGELGPVAARTAEQHIAGCAQCAALKADLEAVRGALRAHASYHRAAPALEARIRGALAAEAAGAGGRRGALLRAPSYWLGTVSGALAAGVVAVAVLTTVGRAGPDPFAHDAVGAHLRALVSGRAIDVESTDRHTVKPWFAGHSDVSPPVADFAADGFTLVGGRVDYLGGERAAVVVYRHNAHVIDVFAWRDAARRVRERAGSENGYRMLEWRSGDLAFCAVSDTGAAELESLKQLLRAAAPGGAGE